MILKYKCFALLWAYVSMLPPMVKSKSDDIAIFYNIYVPDDSDEALNIVKEQLEYKENSIGSKAPLFMLL